MNDDFYRYIHKRTECTFEIMKNNEKYGSYRKMTDALYERDRLMSVDWDWDLYMELEETDNKYLNMKLPPYNHNPSHITYDREHWVVRGKGVSQKYYGTYYSRDEAEEIASLYNANISHRKPQYRIQKRIDGEVVFFGRYKTYADAKRMVEKLEENGWDMNAEVYE